MIQQPSSSFSRRFGCEEEDEKKTKAWEPETTSFRAASQERYVMVVPANFLSDSYVEFGGAI
jgi:hypothetical protein